MLDILAFLWTFYGFPPKSKNDALVCFKPVSKPGAYGPSTPGILLSQDQSWGQTVTLQAHASQIPTRVKAETHSSCLFSGFKAATFSLIISYGSGEMGCHSDRKSQSFLIFNLEAPFWASILQLVVGSVSGRIFLVLPEGKGELCGE